MNKMILTAVALVVLALLTGGYVLNVTKSDNPTTNSDTNSSKADSADNSDKPASTPTPTTKVDTGGGNTGETSQAATLSYTNSGFSPMKIAMKVGAKLIISNDSSRTLQFDSDPHPQHTDHPELNIGLISPGKSATVTIDKAGTYGVHNHLNSSHTATIVVE